MLDPWNDEWASTDYNWGYLGDSFISPGPGGSASGTIVLEPKTITLPGIGSVNITGGTFKIGGSGGTTAREVATGITNQFEVLFQQNLAAYRGKQISQSQALSNFDKLWSEYTNALNQVGQAEKTAALLDRQRGGKFDWYSAYRDTIGHNGFSIGPSPIGSGSSLLGWLQQNFLWVIIVVLAVLVIRSK